jgi:hypothetical protein
LITSGKFVMAKYSFRGGIEDIGNITYMNSHKHDVEMYDEVLLLCDTNEYCNSHKGIVLYISLVFKWVLSLLMCILDTEERHRHLCTKPLLLYTNNNHIL